MAEASELLKEIDSRPQDHIGVSILTKQMETQEKEIEKYNNLKVKLYVDMTDGLIDKNEFMDINATFTAKLDKLNASLHENEKKKEKKLSMNVRDIPWIHDFLQYQNITELDRRVAISLIENVVVYDKDRIEVNFYHKEEMEEMLAIVRQIKEETA
ncbi:MAG: hypothetical protein IKN45_01425 [Lachnospiraceae bacterium]|nr:hypothetical protein [Lachnospiraceae bacterium]